MHWVAPFCTSNNLFLRGFEPFSQQAKHAKRLMLYPFSHRAMQSAIKVLVFIPLKLPGKTLASAYDFTVNIFVLINITNNKTHNIHESV